MTEVIDSISEWWKEKTTSPLYATFIVSVVLWNWPFFYILFWQDQLALSVPKIEYAQIRYLDTHGLIFHFSHFLIFPAISAYIIIFLLPIISNLAHKKSTKFYFSRKVIFDEENIIYENRQKENLESLAEIKHDQTVSKKKIEKDMTEEERWEAEFETFVINPLGLKFKQILETIYKFNGIIEEYDHYSNSPKKHAETSAVAYAHTRGLVLFDPNNNSNNVIKLTDKGKFFSRLYLDRFSIRF